MAVVDVIRRRGRTRIVERPSQATLVDGYAVPGTPTKHKVFATDQPLSGAEIRNLPPGQNATDWRNVWSDAELKLLDSIVLSDGNYTVERLMQWAEGVFWHVQVVRVRDQG